MKMKKLLAIALAFVMVMGMSVTAFAADTTIGEELTNPDAIEVNGKYGDAAPATVYSVKIEWGAMQFTYSTGNTAKWNPATHTYDVTAASAGWTAEGNEVTVTNHSNAKVGVAFTFAPVADSADLGNYTGNIAVEGEKEQLAAAVEGSAVASADSMKATLTFTGTLKAGTTDFTKLGDLTVTLSAAD